MFPKTSLRALSTRGGTGGLRIHPQPQPLRPLFTTSTTTTTTSTTTSTPLRLYNSSARPVASVRPLSSFLRSTPTKSIATSSAASSLLRTIRNNPSATPLLLQQPSNSNSNKRFFTSSARNGFRPTAATMVVHSLKDRASFDAAVATTTAASTASTGQPPKPLVVIDCFATWCGPCKAIAPKLAELSETYPTVGFYKVDVDECPDIAQELGVRAMPTFLFFKDGQKVDEVLGAVPPAIEAAIKKHLS